MLQEQKCNIETELRQTQRELQQSKSQQAAMQAELAVLKRSAHIIPNSHLTALQQNELAPRVSLLQFRHLQRGYTFIVALVVEPSLQTIPVLLFRTMTQQILPTACPPI